MKRPSEKKTEFEKRMEAELAAEAEEEAAEEASEEQAEPADSDTEVARTGAGLDEEAERDEEVDALAAEVESLKEQQLRLRAEFDNYRKRMARQAEQTRKMASEGLVRELLPVLDHLELALQHAEDDSGGFAEGVALVCKQFNEVLNRAGLEPIPALGEPFDPNVHEALMRADSEEHPEDHVMQEYQKGYKLNGQVVRPAKVVVSAGPGPGGGAGKELEAAPNDEEQD